MIKNGDAILVTGCGGALGDAVYKLFQDNYRVIATDIILNEPWLKHLDITAVDEIADCFSEVRLSAVINLAAITDLEYCEQHPAEAFAVNGIGVNNLLGRTRAADIPFVHISTAGVFDGKKENYTESDWPLANPINIYGQSKYLGELAARNYEKTILIRCGWMVGGGPKKDKKFVNKILKKISNEKPEELLIVDDKKGTVSYTDDVAGLIKYLLENSCYGAYHAGCVNSASRSEIAALILKELGLAGKISIKKVSSNDLRGDYFAPRPDSEVIASNHLSKMNVHIGRSWEDCLKEYLEKFSWV